MEDNACGQEAAKSKGSAHRETGRRAEHSARPKPPKTIKAFSLALASYIAVRCTHTCYKATDTRLK